MMVETAEERFEPVILSKDSRRPLSVMSEDRRYSINSILLKTQELRADLLESEALDRPVQGEAKNLRSLVS
jgi:hypothetical protein